MCDNAGGGPGDARVAEPLARLDALDHAGRAVDAAVPAGATTSTALDTLLLSVTLQSKQKFPYFQQTSEWVARAGPLWRFSARCALLVVEIELRSTKSLALRQQAAQQRLAQVTETRTASGACVEAAVSNTLTKRGSRAGHAPH